MPIDPKNYKSKNKWSYSFPKLSDSTELQKEATEIAEYLEYYAYFLRLPTTTALEICGVPEIDLNEMLLSIYKKLLTNDPSVHEKLREVEPDIVFPK
jgi:hypothetical protein